MNRVPFARRGTTQITLSSYRWRDVAEHLGDAGRVQPRCPQAVHEVCRVARRRHPGLDDRSTRGGCDQCPERPARPGAECLAQPTVVALVESVRDGLLDEVLAQEGNSELSGEARCQGALP